MTSSAWKMNTTSRWLWLYIMEQHQRIREHHRRKSHPCMPLKKTLLIQLSLPSSMSSHRFNMKWNNLVKRHSTCYYRNTKSNTVHHSMHTSLNSSALKIKWPGASNPNLTTTPNKKHGTAPVLPMPWREDNHHNTLHWRRNKEAVMLIKGNNRVPPSQVLRTLRAFHWRSNSPRNLMISLSHKLLWSWILNNTC